MAGDIIFAAGSFQDEAANVDLSEYPPCLAVTFAVAIDTICSVCFCSNWREALGISPNNWLYPKAASLLALRPPLLSYQDFVVLHQQSAALAYDDGNVDTGAFSLRRLYQYAFQTDSTELSDLTTPAACLVVFSIVMLIRQFKSVLLPFFSSIGRRVGRKTHGLGWEQANEVRIQKFGEYCFRILYHSMISIYGLWAFLGEDWMARGDEGWSLFNFVGTQHFFKSWPMQPIPPIMTWYYLLQAAYNVDAFVSLLELSFDVSFRSPFFFTKKFTVHDTSLRNLPASFRSPICIKWSKTVRGDFQEMAIHHLATNLLVYNSSCFRFTRIGCAVFMIHDLSDIPVDLCKLANFVKWKATTILCFFVMCLTWLVTRLYILPFVILRSIVVDAKLTMEFTFLTPETYLVYHGMFVVLVGLLVLLHMAWFLMFMKMLAVLVARKECHDLSEHKSGEKHHGHKVYSNHENHKRKTA